MHMASFNQNGFAFTHRNLLPHIATHNLRSQMASHAMLLFHKKNHPLWSLTKYEIWDLICMIFSIKNCIEVVAMLCRTWRPKRRRNIHDSLILPQWLIVHTLAVCTLLLIFYHRISHLKFLHCFFCLFLYDVCQKYIVRNSKSNDK